ncbi:MAG: hypothetical protein HY918_04960 [Candidatus Doudnabacteria bacterium]|nr:hypothetical protein [Candidatus Doudnabacteria bacterium]
MPTTPNKQQSDSPKINLIRHHHSQPYPKINLYRKIAYSFAVLAVLLALIVLHFSLSKAVITVIPVKEKTDTSFIIDVADKTLPPELTDYNTIGGEITEQTISRSQTFPSTGVKTVPAPVIGYVTIFNNYTRDQSLVATTRLLASDNTLFRIKKAVYVPAGGQVDNIEIYPDQPGSGANYPAARFIIPGLWEGLQDKIYAQSFTPTSAGADETTVVSEGDINNAKQSLINDIISETTDKTANKNDGRAYFITQEILDFAASTEAGKEEKEFTATLILKTQTVFFNEQDLFQAAQKKLQAELPPDKILATIDTQSFVYSIEKYDKQTKTANIKVFLSGETIMKQNGALFNKSQIAGMSAQKAKAYLKQLPEVKDVEIQLTPFWNKWIPILEDHVIVEIGNRG